MKDQTFDEAYEESKELYGHPYKELQDYFRKLPKGSLLDLGCGQGRDALFLDSEGFKVTAVDTSTVGVSQMLQKSSSIKGIVSDVVSLELNDRFDIVLFDMILHSFEKEEQKKVLEKYSQNLASDGLFCIVFPDDIKKTHFMDLLNFLGQWKEKDHIVIHDTPKIPGDDSKYTFEMLVVQKI